MPGLRPEPIPTYSPFKEPTVKTWIGHFMDKYDGEVDLTITHKNGDTVTVVLADKGEPGSTTGRELEIPIDPLSMTQDVDLSNPVGKNQNVETFIVKNVAQLANGVTLSLLQAEQGYFAGPAIKIGYSRPARLPGTHRTLQLIPYQAPPR